MRTLTQPCPQCRNAAFVVWFSRHDRWFYCLRCEHAWFTHETTASTPNGGFAARLSPAPELTSPLRRAGVPDTRQARPRHSKGERFADTPQCLHVIVRARDDPKGFNAQWLDAWRLVALTTHYLVAQRCLERQQHDERVRIHRVASPTLPSAICCECRVVRVSAHGLAYRVEFDDWWRRAERPPRPSHSGCYIA